MKTQKKKIENHPFFVNCLEIFTETLEQIVKKSHQNTNF